MPRASANEDPQVRQCLGYRDNTLHAEVDVARRRTVGWWPYSFDPTVASVRIRCLYPAAHLRRSGYPVELFDAKNADNYAAVVFSKHLRQTSLDAARDLQKKGVRIIFDLCDNYFSNPEEQAKRQEKLVRLRQFLELADRVVVSTETLAEVVTAKARPRGPVSVIGDAVEQSLEGVRLPLWRSWTGAAKARYWKRRIRMSRTSGRHALVWFGNRGSTFAGGVRDLATIRDALEAVNRDLPLSLTVISNSRRAYREAVEGWDVPTQYVPWDLENAAKIIAAHDVAVIPVVTNPITICKSNNRLASALYLGVPVVADPIPSYQAFSEACFLGGWEKSLRRYLTDTCLRERHIAKGREIIECDWTIERIASQWAALFDSTLRR